MNNSKKLTLISLLTLFSLLCITIPLRTFALFNSFNTETMHFDNSTTFLLSTIFVVAGVILFLLYIPLAPKNQKFAPDYFTISPFIPAGILSVSLIFMSFKMLERGIKQNSYATTIVENIIYYLPYLIAVFSLLAATFFLLSIMNTKRISNLTAVFGICAIIFFALYGAYLYFSRSIHPINSPNKIINQMAYLSAAIFLLFETRISLGRDMWSPYVSFGLISSLLCGYSAFPSMIFYFAGRDIKFVADGIEECVVAFALFIFIIVKLLIAMRLPDDTLCQTADQIKQMAHKRAEELAERRVAARTHEYNKEEENLNASDSSDENAENSTLTDGQISFELDGSEG